MSPLKKLARFLGDKPESGSSREDKYS